MACTRKHALKRTERKARASTSRPEVRRIQYFAGSRGRRHRLGSNGPSSSRARSACCITEPSIGWSVLVVAPIRPAVSTQLPVDCSFYARGAAACVELSPFSSADSVPRTGAADVPTPGHVPASTRVARPAFPKFRPARRQRHSIDVPRTKCVSCVELRGLIQPGEQSADAGRRRWLDCACCRARSHGRSMQLHCIHSRSEFKLTTVDAASPRHRARTGNKRPGHATTQPTRARRGATRSGARSTGRRRSPRTARLRAGAGMRGTGD